DRPARSSSSLPSNTSKRVPDDPSSLPPRMDGPSSPLFYPVRPFGKKENGPAFPICAADSIGRCGSRENRRNVDSSLEAMERPVIIFQSSVRPRCKEAAPMSTTLPFFERLLDQARRYQDLGLNHRAATLLERLADFRDLPAEVVEETQHRLAQL